MNITARRQGAPNLCIVVLQHRYIDLAQPVRSLLAGAIGSQLANLYGFFFGCDGEPPTKMDYRKKGYQLVPTYSNLSTGAPRKGTDVTIEPIFAISSRNQTRPQMEGRLFGNHGLVSSRQAAAQEELAKIREELVGAKRSEASSKDSREMLGTKSAHHAMKPWETSLV